jgi:hypothetical protein
VERRVIHDLQGDVDARLFENINDQK